MMTAVRPTSIAVVVIAAALLAACTGEDSVPQARANDGPLLVAAASNFAAPAEELAEDFGARSGFSVSVSSGSTGKLYHQISAGAPFHVFLAADRERPQRLHDEGLSLRGPPIDYAEGRLMVWIPADTAGADCLARLPALDGPVSIANPVTAPYGLAAQQAMQALDLWEDVSQRIVTGESIGQAFMFVVSGNAAAGFIAASQLSDGVTGCVEAVDASLHDPLTQSLVVVNEHPAAVDFVEYLASDEAVAILHRYSYRIPEPDRR